MFTFLLQILGQQSCAGISLYSKILCMWTVTFVIIFFLISSGAADVTYCTVQ